MKKIISLIAALAMVGAFVGCDIDMSFKEHTETIKYNNGSVYPISTCVVRDNTVIDMSLSNESNDAYRTITLKSLKEGKTLMTVTSADYCKTADVYLNVLGTGSISGYSDLKEYLYSRSNSEYSERVWKDDTSIANPLDLANGLYYETQNDEGNMDAQNNVLSYIYVNGAVVYYIYYEQKPSAYKYQGARYDYNVTFVRTVMKGTSGNITITYDSCGAVFITSAGTPEYYNEEKFNTSDKAKYGITIDGESVWEGTNWTKDGSDLKNSTEGVVFRKYTGALPATRAM